MLSTELNPSVKPNDITRGKGIKAIPGAIDKASNHIILLWRIAQEVRKSKHHTAAGSGWDVTNFEEVLDGFQR